VGLKFRNRVIPVQESQFPSYDGDCPLCGGELERKRVDYDIQRNYIPEELHASVVLSGLAVLQCVDCLFEWAEDTVLTNLDGDVKSAFRELLASA
jgi:hypothetical protein